MIKNSILSSQFPSFEVAVRAHWVPIILAPISGSYERLVIGVAVANESGFHLEMANALERLRCLYADAAEGVANAVALTADHLRSDLEKRGIRAILEPQPLLSGLEIGASREAEGASFKSIAASWMISLSSLYRENEGLLPAVLAQEALAKVDGPVESASNQLPTLVMKYVMRQRLGFDRYFHPDLRARRLPRRPSRSHEVLIHFAGSHLVANFNILKESRIGPSCDQIKKNFWDLTIERQTESHPALFRRHEMLIKVPDRGNSKFKTGRESIILDALNDLKNRQQYKICDCLRSLQSRRLAITCYNPKLLSIER